MEDKPTRDPRSDDPRRAFLRAIPRKAVEIKTTFGALIADPRSARMRDELRRRLQAFFTLARSYQLPRLAEELRACVDILEATRSLPELALPHIDSLAGHIAAFGVAAERDTGASAEPGAAPSSRPDPARVATVRVAVPQVVPASKSAPPTDDLLAIAFPERARSSPVPPRVSSPLPPRMSSPLPPIATSPPPRPASSSPPRARPSPPRAAASGTALRRGAAAGQGSAAAVHVVYLGNTLRAQGLQGALPAEAELIVTRTAADAAQRAREAGPDVIVVEAGHGRDGEALVQALRRDPLTEFFPVILLAADGAAEEGLRERCPDVADVLPEGADGAAVWESIERVLGGAGAGGASAELGELTLDELTRALQEELRRGIVGAATPRSRGERIPLGEGSDVLAATWGAITRIRDVVERRSQGAVRFELPSAPRGLPGAQVVTLGAEASTPPSGAAGDDPLPGRRVLVVDDDPAVLATFRGLLRDAGAEVHECADGARALVLSRQLRPDLLISDIVMPGLDGFALCRAVRRDPSLRHMPVILLSWKEDLLQRVRSLGAQAQGYLRKEVGGEAILARVRESLRLRERILRRVREAGETAEVRGRLERVGLHPLLEAAATLGDATVTVSDAGSVTELHARGGRLVSALRTARDGSLVRGESALRPVLGVSFARFAVVRSKTVVRENLQGSLQELLTRCARAMLCLEESVSGEALREVHRVELDRDGALAFARGLQGRPRALLERVAEGESPAELIVRDPASATDLEPVLVELVRRDVVRGVLGTGGEDLAARRAARPDALPEPTATAVVPAPRGVRAGDDDRGDVSLADAVWRELRVSVVDDLARRKNGLASHSVMPAELAPAELAEAPARDSSIILPPLDEVPELVGVLPRSALETPSAPVPAGLIAATIPGADPPGQAPVDPAALTRKFPVARMPPEALASPSPAAVANATAVPFQPRAATAAELASLQPVPGATASSPPAAVEPGAALPSIDYEMVAPAAQRSSPPAATASAAPAGDSAASSALAASTPANDPPATAPAPDSDPSEEARDSGEWPVSRASREVDGWSMFRRTAALILAVGGAFAGAYYGVRAVVWSPAAPEVVAPRDPDEPAPSVSAGDASLASAEDASLASAEDASLASAGDASLASAGDASLASAGDASLANAGDASLASAGDASLALIPPRPAPQPAEYRDAAPWLDGGTLPARSGVIVVAPPTDGGAPRVEIDQRDLGAAPVHLVLAEGLHTVRVRDGERWRYQFTTVRAGAAVVLQTSQ